MESVERRPLRDRGTVEHRSETFGTSVDGTPLRVYMPFQGKPKILLMAGQHGDEPETVVLLSTALRAVRQEDFAIAVVLATNPDGLARGTRANARGVDLNRNFPASNWSHEKVCHRWNNASSQEVELGAGSDPGSEPETKALIDLVAEINPATIVTFHAPYGVVDDPTLSPLARKLSEVWNLPLVETIGYPTPGSFGSWAGENNRHVITLELPHDSIEVLRTRFCPALEELMCGRMVAAT